MANLSELSIKELLESYADAHDLACGEVCYCKEDMIEGEAQMQEILQEVERRVG
jgi:hypothetical protein